MTKINISGLLAKQANNQITLRDTANEYDYLLLAFIVLKRITQAISIASGYCFFYYSLSDFITGFTGAAFISAFCAVGLLVGVEAIVSYSLTKCFKFAFKHLWRGTCGTGLIASLFFLLSFYISTQGIYLMKSDTKEIDSNISAKFDEQKQSTILDFNNQIEALNVSISEIIPPQWSKTLTTEQVRLRARYRDEISLLIASRRDSCARIDAAMAAAVKASNVVAHSSASDYYVYVSIILIIELLVNGLIVYFNTLIFRELSKETNIKEQVSIFMNNINSDLSSLIRDSFISNSRYYISAMHNYATNNNNIKTANIRASGQSIKGFVSSANLNDNSNNDNSNNDNNKGLNSGLKTCLCCGVSFTPNHHKQVYCSDTCRLQAWSNRTGKMIKKNGITYKPINITN